MTIGDWVVGETLAGGDEGDVLFGGFGSDSLQGGEGDDIVLGGPGADTLYGDTDFGPFPPLAPPTPLDISNFVAGGFGDDTIFAGFGTDTALGGFGDDLIFGFGAGTVSASGNAVFLALDGPDLLLGGAGDDTVNGGGGEDTILGGWGDDVLRGRDDADLLAGGPGSDSFAFGFIDPFRTAPDTGREEGARDVILDFQQGEDALDLSGFVNPNAPSPPAPGTSEPVFLGTGAFVAEEGFQVRYDVLEDRTLVQFGFGRTGNGDSQAPERPLGEIELIGRHGLAADDFILSA